MEVLGGSEGGGEGLFIRRGLLEEDRHWVVIVANADGHIGSGPTVNPAVTVKNQKRNFGRCSEFIILILINIAFKNLPITTRNVYWHQEIKY